MSNETIDPDAEDLSQCIRNERTPRSYGPYRVEIGDETLTFRPIIISDPVPTGRQILEAAGARPPEDYLLLQMLRSGLLETILLEETTDLRARGVEKFLQFQTDRSFRFQLDGKDLEWGVPLISGMTLKELAKVNVSTYGVWLEVRGAEDRPIADTDFVDFSAPGVERFFTGIVRTTEG